MRVDRFAAPVAVSVGTILTVGALRAWIPSVLETDVRDSPPELVLLVLVPLLLAFVITPVLVGVLGPRTVTVGAAAALVVGRLTLQVTVGTGAQLGVALFVLAAAATWLGAVAAGGAGRRLVAIGVVAGVGLDVTLHAALGTVDAVWRRGAPGWLVVLLILALFAGASALAWRRPQEALEGPGPAWPWLIVGPYIVLHLLLATAPHLVAVGGVGPTIAVGVLAIAHLIAVAAVASLTAVPSRPLGIAGAALLLAAVWAVLATQMPFETPTVYAVSVGAVIVSGALCVAVLGQIGGSGSAAARGAMTLLGLVVAITVAVTHEGHLGDVLTGTTVWGVAIILAVVSVVATVLGGRVPAEDTVAADGHPALLLGASIAAVALIGAVGGQMRTGPEDPEGAAIPLRLVHHNIGPAVGPHVAGAVGSFLADEEPQVVTLTDVGRGALSSGGTDPIPQLARRLGLPHVAAATAADLRGQVVLSALPILEIRTEPLPGPGTPRPDVVVAILDARGLEVAVVTTRFIAGGQEGTRAAQARRVAEVVDDLEGFDLPIVVTGTFWAQPDAAELEPLRDRLRGAGSPPTWPASDPRDVLDQVYVSEPMTVRDLRVGPASRGANLPVSVVIDRGG